MRFRCHVGHAYIAELMSVALDEQLGRAMASALRALDERIFLAQKLARQERASGRTHVADSWAGKAAEFEREAKVIRDAVPSENSIRPGIRRERQNHRMIGGERLVPRHLQLIAASRSLGPIPFALVNSITQQLVLVEKHGNGKVTTREILQCCSRSSRTPNRADARRNDLCVPKTSSVLIR